MGAPDTGQSGAAVLDRAHYQQYRDDMQLHSCEDLALSYAQWCAACKEKT